MLPVVLLKIDTMSPAANVEFGIVIDPLVPTPTNSPMSVSANVYDVVLSEPDCGTFLYPSVEASGGKVYVLVPAAAGALSVAVPDDEPASFNLVELNVWSAVNV